MSKVIDIVSLRNLFIEYAESYMTGEKENDFSITLKKEHSIFVADYCRNIAELEKLNSTQINFIYSAGLLHDVGRFEQYKIYKTFHDASSVDHGDLGTEILQSSEFKSYFDYKEFPVLLYAVTHHNKKDFPKTDDYREYVTRIVRDADKLDIFRVITEVLDSENSGTLTHHLPDIDEYSDDIIDDILEGRQVSYTRRKTCNDVRLTILNWIQDLSFGYSFAHIAEKKYVSVICSSLPNTPRIMQVINHINSFIEKKLLQQVAERHF